MFPHANQILEALHTQSFGQFARRQAGNLAEGAAKCSGIRMELPRKFRKCSPLRGMRKNLDARATSAAEAAVHLGGNEGKRDNLVFPFFARAKENDVAPQRTAGRAGWPAINVCRAHGQHECAVGARVASTSRASIGRPYAARLAWFSAFELCIVSMV